MNPHADSVQQPSYESICNAISVLWNAQCFTIDEMSAFESALRFGTRPAAEPRSLTAAEHQVLREAVWDSAEIVHPGIAAEPSQSGSAGEAADWVNEWSDKHEVPLDNRARAELVAALSRQAPAAPAEVDFEQWWLAEVAANGGVPIGADYKHWAKKGFELRGDARAPAAPAEPAKTEAMITYAHKADASRSTRFRAFATDALPVWAVDIRPEPAKTEASECESGAILRQNGFFSTPPTPEADPQALLGWTRYEKARKLNVAQWAELHQRNLRGENFDDMIDALPATTQPAQQADPTPAEPAPIPTALSAHDKRSLRLSKPETAEQIEAHTDAIKAAHDRLKTELGEGVTCGHCCGSGKVKHDDFNPTQSNCPHCNGEGVK